jgi:DNA-binding SARP family transcriptional activator
VVQLEGERVESSLPGAKGRLLFAYLVLNRARRLSRDELLIAVYGDDASPEQGSSLSVLLSKLRAVVGSELLAGRSEIELALGRDTFVDVEAAFAGIHRAESHAAQGEWAEAWGPAASRTMSRLVPCFRVTTFAGSTSGAGASTMFGCAGSSASQPPGSGWVGQR